jgi:hypothetical protein
MQLVQFWILLLGVQLLQFLHRSVWLRLGQRLLLLPRHLVWRLLSVQQHDQLEVEHL